MYILPSNQSPYQINLPLETIDLINQPTLYTDVKTEDETIYSNKPTSILDQLKIKGGSLKSKKSIKKIKEIDLYKKDDLEKIAKKNNISLKTKDGKIKTKEQLFNSLKRKDLLKKKHKGGNNDNYLNNSLSFDNSSIQIITKNFILISISDKDLIIYKRNQSIEIPTNNKDFNINKLLNMIKDEEAKKEFEDYLKKTNNYKNSII
jgi:hypothetical protein